jgi:pyrroline-5-carboxylate reductase
MRMQGTILLVGCGKMGGALIEGWFKRGLNPVDVMVVEPAGRGAVAPCSSHPALTTLPELAAVPRDFHPDVVVFAVKPQVADAVIPEYQRFNGEHPVFLSVIAGKTTASIRNHLGDTAAVVRAMPNTPAAIGKGITVLFAGAGVVDLQRRICEFLMSAVGNAAWVEDEGLMDAVTAVSGSGPAYAFLLAESMAEAGVAAGLPKALAVQLARATVAGAGAMLAESPEATDVLLRNVTSPGGTTEAALAVLDGPEGLRSLMHRAIATAAARSRALAAHGSGSATSRIEQISVT